MMKGCRHCSYVMPSIVGVHYSFQSYGISFYSFDNSVDNSFVNYYITHEEEINAFIDKVKTKFNN